MGSAILGAKVFGYGAGRDFLREREEGGCMCARVVGEDLGGKGGLQVLYVCMYVHMLPDMTEADAAAVLGDDDDDDVAGIMGMKPVIVVAGVGRWMDGCMVGWLVGWGIKAGV